MPKEDFLSILTVFYPFRTVGTIDAFILESIYESNRTYSRIRIINYSAHVTRGEKPDPEAGTTESGSKGEKTAKSIIQCISG